MMQSEPSTRMVHRVKLGLLAAVAGAIMLVLLLFFLTGPSALRVPYLNVQFLPETGTGQDIALEVALERPLFWEQRRPLAPQPQIVEPIIEPEPEPVIEPLVGVRLLGIMARAESNVALLEVDGEVHRVVQGATIKQWEVSAIEPHEIRFTSHNKQSLLRLEREIHQSIKLETRP